MIVVVLASAGPAAAVPATAGATPKTHQRHHHRKPPVTASPAQAATGDLVAGGSFHLVFDAQRAAGQPVTAASGMFKGALLVGGREAGFFAGPVTCLDVRGNDIGLFYPVEETSPPGGEKAGGGVFITVKTDGAGNAVSTGFMPVPTQTTDQCAPGLAPMSATGHATATGG